jgi:YegS/Rv2252/BmrU family lipid kinase
MSDVADRPGATSLPPLVVANPAARSGRTRGEIETIVAQLQERIGPVDLALTEHAGHATALAAWAVAERRALVISVGGDGVLSEVVNGLLASGLAPDDLPVLGLVAAGTGGDFGRSLGIAPEREAYLTAIAGGRERLVDVGRARFAGNDGRTVERCFVNVLSAGIGGLVDRYTAAMPAAVPGRVAYGAATLAAIAACRRRRILCRATLGDGSAFERILDTHAVVIANGHTFGGGMRVAPAARIDDGLLDVILIETRTKLTMLRYFLSIYRGEHLTAPGVSAFACARVELSPADARPGSTSRPAGPVGDGAAPARRRDFFPLDVDGDALGDLPLIVEVVPARLRVLA